MKRRRYFVVAALLLALLTVVGLPAMSRRAAEVGLVEGRLGDCDFRPNCVCSESPGEAYSIDPLAIDGDPDAAFRSLLEFLRRQPRVTIEESDDDYVHCVFETRLMRFHDDVEFRLDREARVIHVRSASRVGYSDLGKNRSRIEWIRRHWSAVAR